METISIILVSLLLGGFTISLIAVLILSPIEKKRKIKYGAAAPFAKKATEEQKRCLELRKQIFDNNTIMDGGEVINKTGAIEGENEVVELANTYWFAISERYDLYCKKLNQIDPIKYTLHLSEDEILYHRINATEWHEEKAIRTNINYIGTRWQGGPIRSGVLSYSASEIKSFSPIDVGRIFLTNKRLLFIGKQNNISKSVTLNSIATFFLYQDGVLIVVPNKKNILLKFKEFNPLKDGVLSDGINHFTIVLSRILSNNADRDVDYLNEPTDNQSASLVGIKSITNSLTDVLKNLNNPS